MQLLSSFIWLICVGFSAATSSNHCVNCKHFIDTKPPLPFSNPLFRGKCSFFPKYVLPHNAVKKRLDMINYLVSGDKQYILPWGEKNSGCTEYFYCSTARNLDIMCGMDGKYYVEHESDQIPVPPVYDPPSYEPPNIVQQEPPVYEQPPVYEPPSFDPYTYIPPQIDNSEN